MTEQKKYFLCRNRMELDDSYDEAALFAASGSLEDHFAAGLVFEELYTNIYNYAYPEKGGGPVMICMEKTEEGMIMTFADHGVPFNPVERASWSASQTDIGGRGIDLIKSYSRFFKYQRIFDLNIVQVIV